jgi:mannose-6-phosphate isomerase-like protein (cupin superfamily)
VSDRARLEAALADEGLRASPWGNGPGDTYAAHSHGYDKVLVATEGSITFHLTELGRDVMLNAGDRLDLPAGTLHAATVGPSGVACLEAHLPAGTFQRNAPRHAPRGEWP